MKAVPKASTVLGVSLHLLNIVCCFFIFVRFGLLVDAASIFIILSAVMGCFFSRMLLHTVDQSKAAATTAQVAENTSAEMGAETGAKTGVKTGAETSAKTSTETGAKTGAETGEAPGPRV
jgi:adenylate cyclase